MKPTPSEPDSTAGACKYLLIMLLQRLEQNQAGLIDELVSGVATDRAAIERSGEMCGAVRGVFEQIERLLHQARGL